VKFTKRVVKMGDRVNYAKKGDDVSCFYTGRLENGKVFDSNMEEGVFTLLMRIIENVEFLLMYV